MKPQRQNAPRGFAMIVVLVAIAVASILGYALLSGSAIRSQIGQNDSRAATAETLAESGIELAKYYLQNPSAAPPSTLVNGVYAGQSNVSVGSDLGKIESILVSKKSTGVYQAIASGTAGGVRRILTEEITTKPSNGDYVSRFSLAAASGIFLPLNVTIDAGAIRVNGTLSTASGAPSVVVYASAAPVGSTINAITNSIGDAPTYDNLQLLKTSTPSYTYNGTTYYASFFSGTTIAVSMRTPTTGNPLNVWYTTNDARITGNVSMTGTILVVPSTAATKKLIITGNNNVITPVSGGGLPALIVRDSAEFQALGAKLTVNGSVWLGGSVTATAAVTGTNSNPVDLEINGQLMMNKGRTTSTNSFVDSPQVRIKIKNESNGSTTLKKFAVDPNVIGSLSLAGWKTITAAIANANSNTATTSSQSTASLTNSLNSILNGLLSSSSSNHHDDDDDNDDDDDD